MIIHIICSTYVRDCETVGRMEVVIRTAVGRAESKATGQTRLLVGWGGVVMDGKVVEGGLRPKDELG